MAHAGILKSSTNTGADDELLNLFIAPVQFITNRPVAGSESINLKTITSDHFAQRWELEVDIMPTNEEASTFLQMAVVGYTTPFYVRMPQPFRISGDNYYTGSPTVYADAARSSTQVQIHNGTLVAGQFVNIGSNKLYLVTGVTTVSQTVQQISIQPPLRTMTPAGTVLKCGTLATMYAMYSLDTNLSMIYEDGVLATIKGVKIKEKL